MRVTSKADSMVPYYGSNLGMQVMNPFQQLHAVGQGKLQVREQNVNGGMLQDLEGLFGCGHNHWFHPALLGDRGASLADGLLIIDDENVHREHFAADCCFFTHDWNHESLRMTALSAPQVPFQETPLKLFINQYISQKTMWLASISLELIRSSPPAIRPNSGKCGSRSSQPSRQTRSELLEAFSRSPFI